MDYDDILSNYDKEIELENEIEEMEYSKMQEIINWFKDIVCDNDDYSLNQFMDLITMLYNFGYKNGLHGYYTGKDLKDIFKI